MYRIRAASCLLYCLEKEEEMKLENLEREIGYRFHSRDLLEKAVCHSSYINEHRMKRIDCNERLEFLGDAVLELVCSEYLYQKFPKKPEGELSKLRASLVCEPALAMSARRIGLEKYLLLGNGEEATGGRQRDSIISDAMEATIGAIYLDGGITNAKEFILAYVLDDIEHKQLFFDSKTILQERVQGRMEGQICYKLIGEKGPDHDKSFFVKLYIGDEEYGSGQGHTKKAAEQRAAYEALCRIKDQEGQA